MAIGSTAGPDMPPVTFLIIGLPQCRLIRIARTVLIREMPSAPAASQAAAIETISVTFGVSFIIIGLPVTALTRFVTSAASFGSVPKPIPPPCTLGQLIFISNQPI